MVMKVSRGGVMVMRVLQVYFPSNDAKFQNFRARVNQKHLKLQRKLVKAREQFVVGHLSRKKMSRQTKSRRNRPRVDSILGFLPSLMWSLTQSQQGQKRQNSQNSILISIYAEAKLHLCKNMRKNFETIFRRRY